MIGCMHVLSYVTAAGIFLDSALYFRPNFAVFIRILNYFRQASEVGYNYFR
jgi:hypothetical protein